MMQLAVDPEPVPLVRDEHGAWRVGGTRVTLETLVAAVDCGDSAEEIHEQYPSVALGDVYAVLTDCLRRPVAWCRPTSTSGSALVQRCKTEWSANSRPTGCVRGCWIIGRTQVIAATRGRRRRNVDPWTLPS